MKYYLPFLLLPASLYGQVQKPVEPVASPDYIALVKKQQLQFESLQDSSLVRLRVFNPSFYWHSVGNVKVTGDVLTLSPVNVKTGWLSGNFQNTFAIRQANQQSPLQHTYAQGSSAAGALVWRGAETGEMFSYGPALASLEFDGSHYPYDAGGRLTPTGTGQKATAYNNGILRTASYLSQSLSLQGGFRSTRNGAWLMNTSIGHTRENTFIRNNQNNAQNLSASLTRAKGRFEFTAGYRYNHDAFTNSNRIGFLNRAYMNSLLTPVSFNNAYSPMAYGNGADNAYTQLGTSGKNYGQTQHTGSLAMRYRRERTVFNITQSYESLRQNSHEGYLQGAAVYPDGISTKRHKTDQRYYLKVDATLPLRPNARYAEVQHSLQGSSIFTDHRVAVNYNPQQLHYRYQRSANQLQLKYVADYKDEYLRIAAHAGNSFYFSNTANTVNQFAPLVNVLATIDFFYGDLVLDFYGTFQTLNSELPLNNSLAGVNLLQYSTADFSRYFPIREAEGYDALKPLNSHAYSAKATLSYRYLLSLSAEWFRKDVRNDVFPLFTNNRLELQNIAGHRRQGLELQLSQYRSYSYSGRLRASNTLSFITYTHRITEVAEGRNYTPVAGFSNIHKAIVKGQPMGAIAGSAYVRNENNQVVIGSDGFPLVDGALKVIGNPIPDFVLKLNNEIECRNWLLHTDLEWRKGGTIWDGTAAVLDYYGRSANSAALRNTTGYVFNGVLENGRPNNIPVSFYNPAHSFAANRWVRYGHSGVGEEYIRKADLLKLNQIELGYYWTFKSVLRKISVAAFASNIILWSANKGTDPGQLLLDQPGTEGLNFFNLPSTRTYGIHTSFQF